MKKLMLLTMMFGLFFIAPDNNSAQSVREAAAEGNSQKICSKDGGEAMDISWKNNTNMTLRINWVNSACEEQKSDREIKPGEVFDGGSYVGHWYIIRDFKTDKQLGRREVKAEYANMGIPK